MSTEQRSVCTQKAARASVGVFSHLGEGTTSEELTDTEQGAEPGIEDDVERVPVTKEYMAVVVAGKHTTGHESEECFVDALYDSVAGLIYSNAKKYSYTCRDEIADLVQDCAYRIFLKIKQFSPKKGAFTTWCWRVCRSVLDRNYRKDQKLRERFAEYDRFEEMIGDSGPQVMDSDISEVVSRLFERYPEKRKILVRMFGDPRDALYVPDRICITHVARDLGMEYNHVYSFFHRVVRPFFKERFLGVANG